MFTQRHVFVLGVAWVFLGIAQVGKQAPPFALRDSTGKMYYLSDYCGASKKPQEKKILVVNFFATWCKPCKAELPLLEKLWNEKKAKGLDVVSIGFHEDEGKLLPFLKQNPIKIPLLMDRHGVAAEAYGVKGLPRTFLLDKDCMVKKEFRGALPDMETVLRQEIEKLLK